MRPNLCLELYGIPPKNLRREQLCGLSSIPGKQLKDAKILDQLRRLNDFHPVVQK